MRICSGGYGRLRHTRTQLRLLCMVSLMFTLCLARLFSSYAKMWRWTVFVTNEGVGKAYDVRGDNLNR